MQKAQNRSAALLGADYSVYLLRYIENVRTGASLPRPGLESSRCSDANTGMAASQVRYAQDHPHGATVRYKQLSSPLKYVCNDPDDLGCPLRKRLQQHGKSGSPSDEACRARRISVSEQCTVHSGQVNHCQKMTAPYRSPVLEP
jgi:hypothetical protein